MPAPTAAARRLLLDAYAVALGAADPRATTTRALAAVPPGPLRAIVAGKAAEGMLAALLASPGHPLVAAVVAAPGPAPRALAADPRLAWHQAGHPLPDAGSLAAGAAALALVDAAPADAAFVVLLSGGASALLERPREGVTLAPLRDATARGLADGADIATLNRRRAELSQLKAGGLAARIGPRPLTVLYMSDVPDDDPRVVGSGPCWDGRVPHRAVVTNADARRAVARWAAARGIAVADHGLLVGEATAQGRAIAARLAAAAPGLQLWGGECTVALPAGHGRGGRCQQLALAAVAAGLAPGDALLACGSDGRDGPDPRWRAAGALVDGGSAARLVDAGVDAAAALARCDAGPALAAAGDLVDSGPTGTNVGDLVFGWRAAPAR